MLAIDFAQLLPISISVLVAVVVSHLMRVKLLHRPRELFKDESSKIDVELEAELQPLKPALPAFSTNSVERVHVADAALQTKLMMLDQLLVEADREVGRLTELLHEIRSIRVPGVVRDDDFNDSQSDERDEADSDPPFGSVAHPVKVDKQQFVRMLHQSGFSPEEVAKAVKLPLEIVLAILGIRGDQERAAS